MSKSILSQLKSSIKRESIKLDERRSSSNDNQQRVIWLTQNGRQTVLLVGGERHE